MSKNLFKGLEIVAQRHGLKHMPSFPDGEATFNGKPIAMCPMDSMNPDYDPFETLKKGVAGLKPGVPSVFVGHPGYLDDFILKNSSLTVNRTKEVAMLCDPAVKAWLDDQGVELISYDDV